MAAVPLNNNLHHPFLDSNSSSASNKAGETGGEERYHLLNVINRGSYGVVHRAWDKETEQIVAIKQEIHGLSRSTLREIAILQSLPPHPSIVEFKEVIVDAYRRVFVVMEYVESDLDKLSEAMTNHFTVSEVKFLLKQILEGVAFLHSNGVMHRDLKPANILTNKMARLKICDFGLSRPLGGESGGSYTPGVVTQWYRAPELLLGAKDYSTAIDMWSVGCIMAELVLGEVIFPGDSELQQLRYIWRTVGGGGGGGDRLRRKVSDAATLGGAPLLSASGVDLLERLLAFDPKERITAMDALNHAWFKEFYGLVAD